MASNVVRRSSDPTIMEHDVVRLSDAIVSDEGLIPVGETGTVVHIYRDGTAFEVEFDAPFHVVTVMATKVERVSV